MPCLIQTDHRACVVWLGQSRRGAKTFVSHAAEEIILDFGGLAESRHEGANRRSCSRVGNLYPTGTEIRNVRQLTLLSQEELFAISEDMQMDVLDPGLLGASVVLSGLPDFSHIPPSSRLQGSSGVTITIDMENRTCHFPGREIDAQSPGFGNTFKSAAEGRRGVTAWVERPGSLKMGDELRLFVPDQRPWSRTAHAYS